MPKITRIVTEGAPTLPPSILVADEDPDGSCLLCGRPFRRISGMLEAAWVAVGARGWAHVYVADCTEERD